MSRKVALALTALVMSFAPVPAISGTARTAIVSGPGSYFTTYSTPSAVAVKGTPVTYVNLDIATHDVVSFATGPATQPWCASYTEKTCPLFWSDLIPIGRSTPVLGLENAKTGAYRFYCSLHPSMVGVLVVAGS